MANYLYNEVELPELPVVEGYPYTALFELSINSFYVYFAKIPWVANENSNGVVQLWLDDSLGDDDDAPYYRFTDGTWEYRGEHVSWGRLNGINSCQLLRDLRWCNSDILWATEINDGTALEYGSVCFAGSDPVPVGGETEPEPEPEPTLTESDFYKVVNRQWVKHDAVKSTGSEWVKQPQKGYETQGGQWSALS